VTGPVVFVAVVGALVLGLGALIVVDKRRPIRHLDDRPDPLSEIPGAYLGDGDLDHHLNVRLAAESRLHRRHT
jgi:hypothetical protein